MPEAARTLVKSPPELWSEVSDPESLTRHLGAFGEIRITRLDPETTVAWEGDRVRGTVDLAPAGWGTKVTVTAEEVAAAEPPAEEVLAQAAETPEPPEPVEEAPETGADEEPETAEDTAPEEPARGGLRGFFARLFGGGRREEPVAQAPAPEEPEAAPGPATIEAEEPEVVAVADEPPAAVAAEEEPGEADTAAVLDEMLGNLGAAHHRPFSR